MMAMVNHHLTAAAVGVKIAPYGELFIRALSRDHWSLYERWSTRYVWGCFKTPSAALKKLKQQKEDILDIQTLPIQLTEITSLSNILDIISRNPKLDSYTAVVTSLSVNGFTKRSKISLSCFHYLSPRPF